MDPTEIPNASRIYDYTLGGTHNFPADRAAAEHMFSLVPSTPKWVRMLRAFMQTAARRLRDEGYAHFVDFASGLPLDDHVHHVLPDAKVVYSDVDPFTREQARELVGGLPNALYLRHDVREARALLGPRGGGAGVLRGDPGEALTRTRRPPCSRRTTPTG